MTSAQRLALGAEIERLRLIAVPAMTRREFLVAAASAGAASGTVTKILRGAPSWKPNAETLGQIARALACTPAARTELFRIAGIIDPKMLKAWWALPEEARAAVVATLRRARFFAGNASAGPAIRELSGRVELSPDVLAKEASARDEGVALDLALQLLGASPGCAPTAEPRVSVQDSNAATTSESEDMRS